MGTFKSFIPNGTGRKLLFILSVDQKMEWINYKLFYLVVLGIDRTRIGTSELGNFRPGGPT